MTEIEKKLFDARTICTAHNKVFAQIKGLLASSKDAKEWFVKAEEEALDLYYGKNVMSIRRWIAQQFGLNASPLFTDVKDMGPIIDQIYGIAPWSSDTSEIARQRSARITIASHVINAIGEKYNVDFHLELDIFKKQ